MENSFISIQKEYENFSREDLLRLVMLAQESNQYCDMVCLTTILFQSCNEKTLR